MREQVNGTSTSIADDFVRMVWSPLTHQSHLSPRHARHLFRSPQLPTLVLTGLTTIVGLSPYLYLVLRASIHAADGWGDQRSISGFLTHFLRREYGTFVLASEWESGEEQVRS